MSNALLLSASRADHTDYLEHALPFIKSFLSGFETDRKPVLLFIPYAGVTVSYDAYFEKVKTAISSLDITFQSIHHHDDPAQAILNADVVLIGGGNTFSLLDGLYKRDLINLIRERVKQGMGYIGWSAGSNIAGLSIKTTNDMPIVEPPSFNALGLIPLQLNPHYTDYQAPGHNGETREMRLSEFMVANPAMPVIGLQEGSALLLKNDQLTLLGNKPAYIFHSMNKTEVEAGHDFSELLKANYV